MHALNILEEQQHAEIKPCVVNAVRHMENSHPAQVVKQHVNQKQNVQPVVKNTEKLANTVFLTENVQHVIKP